MKAGIGRRKTRAPAPCPVPRFGRELLAEARAGVLAFSLKNKKEVQEKKERNFSLLKKPDIRVAFKLPGGGVQVINIRGKIPGKNIKQRIKFLNDTAHDLGAIYWNIVE